jgi:hypothetical protein
MGTPQKEGNSLSNRRRILSSTLRSATSLIRNFHSRYWELTLECGHIVERRTYHTKSSTPLRGWEKCWKTRSLKDVVPPPKYVLCEECKAKRQTKLQADGQNPS